MISKPSPSSGKGLGIMSSWLLSVWDGGYFGHRIGTEHAKSIRRYFEAPHTRRCKVCQEAHPYSM